MRHGKKLVTMCILLTMLGCLAGCGGKKASEWFAEKGVKTLHEVVTGVEVNEESTVEKNDSKLEEVSDYFVPINYRFDTEEAAETALAAYEAYLLEEGFTLAENHYEDLTETDDGTFRVYKDYEKDSLKMTIMCSGPSKEKGLEGTYLAMTALVFDK